MSDRPTSETEFGIIEQPQPTCPLIDEAIKTAKLTLRDLKGHGKMDKSGLRSACEDAEYRLSSIFEELELVRKNVERIRQWGQEWKDRCKSEYEERTANE